MIDSCSEFWLPVVGYEGYYEVSNLGAVRSLPRHYMVSRKGKYFRQFRKGQLIAQRTLPSGHKSVYLRAEALGKPGAHHSVHRLVLRAFVGPCPAGLVCCHNDGDPANNRVSNLRWDTQMANVMDAFRHGTRQRQSTTECTRGHTDVLIGRSGFRRCRVCERNYKRAERARKVLAS